MDLLRFNNLKDYFEMGIATEENHSRKDYGDAYITIRIQSHGFTGNNDLWVTGNEFALFCKSLLELENKLKGEAILNSISPNELRIRIHSISSRGHLAIEGETGYNIQGQNSSFWHSVSFGIEFEPSQLSEAIKLSWIKRYAELLKR